MKGFFEDAKGERSMMRLLSFIVVVTGCAAFISEVVWNLFYPMTLHPMEIGLFTAIGFTGKAIQKHTEK